MSFNKMIQDYNYFEMIITMFVKSKKAKNKKIVIYPYGTRCRLVESLLKDKFGIEPELIIDNNLCREHDNVYSIEKVREFNTEEYAMFLCSELEEVRHCAREYFDDSQIMDVFWECRDARVNWLDNFSKYVYEVGINGNVAEAGVYRGEFAKHISQYFPDRKLYLVDPFNGFREEDVEVEKEGFSTNAYVKVGSFSDTSADMVKNKMPNKENVVMKVGYVPEIIKDLEDTFCFVNLDMDLYQPTYEALKIFWPQMVQGGIILVHDYFWPDCPGIKQAIDDYEKLINSKFLRLSIGDNKSIALVKM